MGYHYQTAAPAVTRVVSSVALDRKKPLFGFTAEGLSDASPDIEAFVPIGRALEGYVGTCQAVGRAGCGSR